MKVAPARTSATRSWAVEAPPAFLGGLEQLRTPCRGRRPSSRRHGDAGAELDGREAALDRFAVRSAIAMAPRRGRAPVVQPTTTGSGTAACLEGSGRSTTYTHCDPLYDEPAQVPTFSRPSSVPRATPVTRNEPDPRPLGDRYGRTSTTPAFPAAPAAPTSTASQHGAVTGRSAPLHADPRPSRLPSRAAPTAEEQQRRSR
jgi:hypothetical protein